jgi:hypothetical protein
MMGAPENIKVAERKIDIYVFIKQLNALDE